MPLFKRQEVEAVDKRVRSARSQLDEAIAHLEKLLDAVKDEATEAREELHERRTG